MKFIKTNKAPAAIGPYSQGVLFENILFISGQIGINPENGELLNGIMLQTKQTLNNLKQILDDAGMTYKDVVKTTLFLINMNDFQEVNNLYSDFFIDHRPARSTVEVRSLPRSALIEIETIAMKR